MKRRVTHHMKSLVESLRGAHFLVAAAMIANVFNFLFSTYIGRETGFAEFGLISLIGSFLSIAQIPLSSYSRTIVYKTAYLLGKYNVPAAGYWRKLRSRSIKPSLILTGLWLIASPFLAWYFHSEHLLPFILFTPVWAIGVTAAVDSGFLSGSHAFTAVAIMTVVESVVKFIATVFFIQTGLTSLVYFAFPLSSISAFLIGWYFATKIHNSVPKQTNESVLEFPKKFFASTILTKLSSVAILSFDVILSKHYLAPTAAGEYALLSLVGNMIYFLGSLISQFVIPFVGRDVGAGKKSDKAFHMILLFTTLADLAGFVGVGIFGFITVPLLFGAKSQAIIPFLPLYTFAMAAFSVGNTVVSYYQARSRHQYSLISVITAIGVIVGISTFHESVYQVNLVMCANAFIFLGLVFIFYVFEGRMKPFFRNLEDLFRLFTDVYKVPRSKEQMSILIFNWRDTKHVWAGGAENYIHGMAKQWVKNGHRVTIFCGNDQQSVRNEVIDGVQIVRRGGFYTVYFWAFLYYVLRFRGNFDIVLDSENGIPFFTPLFVRVPVYLLIHHVHQEVLKEHLAFPLSHIGMFLESTIMPWIYKDTPVFTVSESSKEDIIQLGFTDASRVHVIYPGIDNELFQRKEKTRYPSMVYLGRLKDYKHIDVAIHAFVGLKNKYKQARFIIAGEGTSEKNLQRLVKKLHADDSIVFKGKVSDEEKVQLLATHWVMVQPSDIEGWGMTVIEANACGTPVVASDVKGLRDSVRHQKTGLLFQSKNSTDLAMKIDMLFSDDVYREKLGKGAYQWSKNFGWDECATRFLDIVGIHLDSLSTKKPAGNGFMYSKSV